MYVHTRERDSRPGFDGVKIKLLLLLYIIICIYIYIYIYVYIYPRVNVRAVCSMFIVPHVLTSVRYFGTIQ